MGIGIFSHVLLAEAGVGQIGLHGTNVSSVCDRQPTIAHCVVVIGRPASVTIYDLPA